jgi:hypothetical protein
MVRSRPNVALLAQSAKYTRSLGPRDTYQPGQDQRHRQVNPDQNDVARITETVQQNSSLGRSEAVYRNPQEYQRVNQGDHGALAIVENPKVVHTWLIQFRLRTRILV